MLKYDSASQATDDNIIRRMRFSFWINKATDTHSEYLILIVFTSAKWLRERALILNYTYTAYLVLLLSAPVFCIYWVLCNSVS